MIQPHPQVSHGPHPLGHPEGDIAHQRELQMVQELSGSSQHIIHVDEENSSQHARYSPIGHKQKVIVSEVNQVNIKPFCKKSFIHNIILQMNFFDSLGTIYGFPTETTTVEGRVL